MFSVAVLWLGRKKIKCEIHLIACLRRFLVVISLSCMDVALGDLFLGRARAVVTILQKVY